MRRGHRDWHGGVGPYCGVYDQLNKTYFRSQTADYRPGEGFVPVRFSDSDIEQMAGEMEEANRVP
jgi:hypothetical protein